MTDWDAEIDRKYHPIANIFPLLEGPEFDALKESIVKNGLLDPIAILSTGSIIDGRNRHRACIETETPPSFEPYVGDETPQALWEYVKAKNKDRRHLTSSQWAVIAISAEDVVGELEQKARERQSPGHNQYTSSVEIIPPSEQGKTRDLLAEMYNTNPRYVQDAKSLQENAPDLLEEVRSGDKSIPQAKKELSKRERENERQQIAQQATQIPPSDRWHIYHADMQTWTTTRRYDFIITDPPYPREYLPLYEVLAERAQEWLAPGGLLVAMCGQSYLEQIVDMMSRHLEYYWTAAYLTPGQPTPLRQRQVNTTWKPLLIFTRQGVTYQGKIFGDVFTSDRNEKEFHKWGQSVSGMFNVVSQICLPGQSILDPFCGAGTTGIAALKHGCLFDGLDIEEENTNISIGRLADYDTKEER